LNVLLSHGSPGEAHRQAVEALAGKVAAELGEPVGTAFLGDALPAGARLLPLFLTRGRHLVQDVPAMVGTAGAELLPGPADDPADVAQMALELAQTTRTKQRAVMFALYRLGDAEALMAELYDYSKQFPLPAIAGVHGQCSVASVLQLWAEEGIGGVLIQPLLLFPGHSLDLLRQVADASGLEVAVGPALSEHGGFAGWLASRFKGAA
jgi:sirohydrochlorin ferrochelatase